MDRDNEIKNLLTVIAHLLNKHDLLDNDSFDEFISHINEIQTPELIHFACRFLSLSLLHGKIYYSLRDEFERIYNILLTSYLDNGEDNVALKSSLGFIKGRKTPICLDCFFDNLDKLKGIKVSNVSVLLTEDLKESLLEQFYYIGADIYEMTSKPIDGTSS